jgi:ankyrin repeat protein
MAVPNFYKWLVEPAQKNKTPEELAKLFIESGPELTNDQGKTLLHYSADEVFNHSDKFRLALINLLFEQKADANSVDNNGRTALHDFAAAPHIHKYLFFDNPIQAIAEIFFKNFAQFNIKDNENKTPLDWALQHSDPNTFVIKPLIKFMLLEQPNQTQPSSIDSHERASEYWNIYKNNIAKLQEQKIPGTECTLYDICAARNLTQLAKQHSPYHQQIQKFDSEELKNKFYEYSDHLLVNLKSLQQEMIKITNTNAAIPETRDSINRNVNVEKNLQINEDVVREIFNYLSPKEIQKMHVAVNPHALFRYKPELAEQANSQEKTNKSSCCIL